MINNAPKQLYYSSSVLIRVPPCTTVNPPATVKTLWDQPISRVEYIRIELHNAAFFITSSTAFVIQRAFFQPRKKRRRKRSRKDRKTWSNFQCCQPVSQSATSKVSCFFFFCSASQYASLLVPYERGFVRPVEVQPRPNAQEANVSEAINVRVASISSVFFKKVLIASGLAANPIWLRRAKVIEVSVVTLHQEFCKESK